MKNFKHLGEYSTGEIQGVLAELASEYEFVQLVDVEECRILHVQEDGSIRYGEECYHTWNRHMRCAHCSGYQACMTHHVQNKYEKRGDRLYDVSSRPIYLEMPDGELELCALEYASVATQEVNESVHFGYAYLNAHDVLTGLFTQDKLYREIRSKLMEFPDRPWLLMEGNIRNFKLINRLFGLEEGNQVLIGMAEMLRGACTDQEVYGRYRDDRFLVLISKDRFSEAQVLRHLNELKSLLESPMYSVQVQVGLYEITDVNMPISTMLDHVDMALRTIEKSRQKVFSYYSHSLMEETLKTQQIITGFDASLASGQFQIYLQPQVLFDGQIHGAESLARWVRPDGRVTPPGEFIPVLHQSDMLSSLDKHIWEQAAKVLNSWKGTPMEGLYISINIDPSDFYYMDVPETLEQLCKKYDISPKLLRVEITETAIVNEAEKQSAIVEQLQDHGFIVEIDDFGKGSSSLSMLKDVRADVLKIDMGFISGKENRDRSKVILESVIGMADQLNMDVIAEGVETREQVRELSELGCENFQGYYFSRPIPVEDFEEVFMHIARRDEGE